MNNDVSDYVNWFFVTHTRGENPARDNLNGLLLEIVSPGRQHRGFMYVTISADHAVYRNVIPGSGPRRGRLWKISRPDLLEHKRGFLAMLSE